MINKTELRSAVADLAWQTLVKRAWGKATEMLRTRLCGSCEKVEGCPTLCRQATGIASIMVRRILLLMARWN